MTQTNTAPALTTEISEAQLYWDAQDAKNAGWFLRYRDSRGTEQGLEIEAEQDATTAELAELVAAADVGDGEIIVFRGHERRGSIKVEDGKVLAWRAL